MDVIGTIVGRVIAKATDGVWNWTFAKRQTPRPRKKPLTLPQIDRRVETVENLIARLEEETRLARRALAKMKARRKQLQAKERERKQRAVKRPGAKIASSRRRKERRS